MNIKDEIAAQELIIAYAQAEIKGLESRQGKRFKPENGQKFWYIRSGRLDAAKSIDSIFFNSCFNSFNCYETKALANKAAVMIRRNNAIIMACLMVDPDFVPNYLSGNQEHYSFECINPSLGDDERWEAYASYVINRGPCVSTQKKWKEAAALLKEWGIE
jgi:hypothetical protein